MILHPHAAVETSGPGGFDDGLEIAVIGVTEDFCKVAAGPELVARRIGAADAFKWRNFFGHGFILLKGRGRESRVESREPRAEAEMGSGAEEFMG